jgi:hypothetical protein
MTEQAASASLARRLSSPHRALVARRLLDLGLVTGGAAASITCLVMAISRFAPLVGLWRFRPGRHPELADRREAPAPPVETAAT